MHIGLKMHAQCRSTIYLAKPSSGGKLKLSMVGYGTRTIQERFLETGSRTSGDNPIQGASRSRQVM